MGAWGSGVFENDGAGDFLVELEEAEHGWALIRETLSTVADAGRSEYVEAPECDMALVAAECVAAARGKPCTPPNDEVVRWCGSHPMKDLSRIAALAARAVQRIRTSSELNELKSGTGEKKEWLDLLADLEKRLL